MFTGIVESLGKIESVSGKGSASVIIVNNPIHFEDAKKGASLAVNGACLTYLEVKSTNSCDSYTFEVSKESLTKSNLGGLKAGDHVNLERPVKASARFEGHIVLGHVDTTVIFDGARSDSREGSVYRFFFEGKDARYFVEKGSVALNGTSLTVFDLEERGFSVVLLPHTLEATNLKHLRRGDAVNCEFDIIGKYIERMISNNAHKGAKSSIDREFLAKHGF